MLKKLLLLFLIAAAPVFAQLKPGTPAAGDAATLTGGPITIDDGSNIDPAYSFTNETGTGVYRAGASNLGFSISGTLELDLNATQLDLNSNNLVSVGTIGSGAITSTGSSSFGASTFSATLRAAAGLVSAPSFSFSGETGTGMFSEGTFSLGFAVAGVLELTLNSDTLDLRSNDLVGVGIISSGAITSTGTSSFGESSFSGTINASDGTALNPSLQWTSDDDGSGTGMYRSGADELGFSNNGAASLVFTSAGNADFQDGEIATTGAIRMGGGITYTNADITMAGAAVQLAWDETDGAVDNRIWDIEVEGEQFRWRLINDAISVATNWLTVDRTGMTVDIVDFPNGVLHKGGTQFMDNSRNMTNVGTIGSGAITSTGSSSFGSTTFGGDVDMAGFDIDNAGFLILNAATAPASTEEYIVRDNTNDMTLNVPSGGAINLAIAGTDEVTFSATQMDLTGLNIVNAGTIGSGAITPTGVIRGPDGGTTAPTYSFSGDTNTGMFHGAGADDLRFTAGGLRLTINTVLASWTIRVDHQGSDVDNVGRLNVIDFEALTLSGTSITVTDTYVSVTAEAAQTLDSLATINGGEAGDLLILTAADTDDIFIDVDGGNINGTDRTLDGTGDTWFAVFDGTNWTEISFSDND